jgi:3-methylcrotonyl-CoA carboxylase alpha subunit
MIWTSGDRRHHVDIRAADVVVDGTVVTARSEPVAAGIYRVTIGDRTETLHGVVDGGVLHFFWRGRAYRLRPAAAVASAPNATADVLEAPMPGRVIDVRVVAGDAVRAGQALVVLEAMKMETVARAPRDGRVRAVRVAAGERVAAGAVLVELE